MRALGVFLAAAGMCFFGYTANSSQPASSLPEHQLLESASNKVRANAALVLGRRQGAAAAETLAKALASDKDPVVRGLCAKMLGGFVGLDEKLRQALERALSDKSAAVAKEAARAIERLQKAEPLRVTVLEMGDQKGKISAPLRTYLREVLMGELSKRKDVTVATSATPSPTGVLVDGTIKTLVFTTKKADVELTCVVGLVISRPPRGIVLMTSGEATVIRPKAFYKPADRFALEKEAVDGAARSAHETLSRYLDRAGKP